MSYAIRQYLLNIYIYWRFCRLCIINCENKNNYLRNIVPGVGLAFLIVLWLNGPFSLDSASLIITYRPFFSVFSF
jgi:hypothetical protein